MAKLTRYIVFAVIVMLTSSGFLVPASAQQNHTLIIKPIDKDSGYVAKHLNFKTGFKDADECLVYVLKLPDLLQSKGYISASVDSFTTIDNHTVVDLYVGQLYNNLELHVRENDKLLLQQLDLGINGSKRNTFHFSQYAVASQKILDYFESVGYPFAKVNLDSITLLDDKIEAVLNVEKGFPYKIDSIRLYGSAKISRNFIHRYLNIERGEAYNKTKLEKVNQRLLELPFIEQSQPWDLTMLNTGGLVNLYLQPKRSNQVNILAGFLPSNQQVGGKLLLTVDANLQLQNPFGGGESLGLVWQQIQPKSPRLHLNFTQPYMFNSPFGVDFNFDLYKRDSAFLNINGQLGLLYMLSPNKTGKVIIQSQKTNVLQLDTFSVIATKRLPDVADVSSLNLGFDYDVNNTDYRFNPRKGNEFSIFVSAGNKTIRKNNAITSIKDGAFDYNSLYDSIKLKTYQLRLRLKAAHYFKLGKQSVLKAGANAGLFESANYFRNELFQIGGYRLLRGFDEESIFTNRYMVATVEYRYLLSLNSNFFVFSDFGLTKNNIANQSNSYFGSGLGLSFQTKGGIFNISYAAGKRNDIDFNIKQSKIHFGYVSIF